MKLKIWQVDAFASKPLEGNPAAIVPLESWLDAGLMQRIAAENNVAETAFFVKIGPGAYDLRWSAPSLEVDLCGHATLEELSQKYGVSRERVRQIEVRAFEKLQQGMKAAMTAAALPAPA